MLLELSHVFPTSLFDLYFYFLLMTKWGVDIACI